MTLEQEFPDARIGLNIVRNVEHPILWQCYFYLLRSLPQSGDDGFQAGGLNQVGNVFLQHVASFLSVEDCIRPSVTVEEISIPMGPFVWEALSSAVRQNGYCSLA